MTASTPVFTDEVFFVIATPVCGKSRELGTFFSILIDDIRIYNQAVHP
jgi:hypothetical protein